MYVPINKCHRNFFIDFEGGGSYSKITLNDKEDEITYNICKDNDCNEESCEFSFSSKYVEKDFVPTPINFNHGEMGKGEFVSRRYLSKGNADDLKENDFASVFFDSKESCENNDVSKANFVEYFEEHGFECKEVFDPFTQKHASQKCTCNKETNYLECTEYHNSTQCEGTGVKLEDNDPCSTIGGTRFVCGTDFKLSSHLKNGIMFDSSQDMFYKAEQKKTSNEKCEICEIDDSKLEWKECAVDKKTHMCPKVTDESHHCENVYNQEYKMSTNLFFEYSSQLPIYLMSLFSLSYFNPNFFYAYQDLPLEFVDSKKGKENEVGYYDVIYNEIGSMGGDIQESSEGIDRISYLYSAPEFEYCVENTKYTCEDDGVVKKCTYEPDTDCAGDPILEVVQEHMTCGALPHENGDITPWITLLEEILLLAGGAAATLVLVFVLNFCCCWCAHWCMYGCVCLSLNVGVGSVLYYLFGGKKKMIFPVVGFFKRRIEKLKAAIGRSEFDLGSINDGDDEEDEGQKRLEEIELEVQNEVGEEPLLNDDLEDERDDEELENNL